MLFETWWYAWLYIARIVIVFWIDFVESKIEPSLHRVHDWPTPERGLDGLLKERSLT